MSIPQKTNKVISDTIAALKLKAVAAEQKVEEVRARVHAVKESLKSARKELKEVKIQAKQARKSLKAEKKLANKNLKKPGLKKAKKSSAKTDKPAA